MLVRPKGRYKRTEFTEPHSGAFMGADPLVVEEIGATGPVEGADQVKDDDDDDDDDDEEESIARPRNGLRRSPTKFDKPMSEEDARTWDYSSDEARVNRARCLYL